MLNLGSLDSVQLWPVAFWPIVFSSCFCAYLRICQITREKYGYSPIGGRRRADRFVTWVALPFALSAEIVTHGFMLCAAGLEYALIGLPIYVFGWILLPTLLEGMRGGLPLLASIHVLFVAAFAVLLGLADISVLRALNGDILAILSRLPTPV